MLALLMAAPAAGCASERCEDGSPAPCARAVEDGGPGGGRSDAGPAIDAGFANLDAGTGPMPPPTGVDPGRSEGFFDGEDDGARSCYDGLNNDADVDGAVDCEDVLSCGASPYCCVGSAEWYCCDSDSSATSVAFDACASSDPTRCVGVGEMFGSPSPAIEDGRFVANGDDADSGILLGEALDPTRERLTLAFTVRTPAALCRDCADVVALALGDAPQAGARRVVPDVALMVRSAHSDAVLVLGDDIVWRAPIAPDVELSYQLETSPDGTLVIYEGAEEAGRMELALRPERRLLLYGRTPNRAVEANHLAVPSVSVTRAGCEMPDALRPDALPLELGGTGPSVLRDGEYVYMALSNGTGIALARSPDGGRGWTGLDEPPLTHNAPLHDPSLVLEGGALVAYAARVAGEGAALEPQIVRAVHGDAGWETATPVTMPEGRWAQPTVLVHQGRLLMAAVSLDDGAIVLLEQADDRFEILQTVVTPGPSFDHFDPDEVADPALVVDAQALIRLYYAGRRGTRWAVGMLLSGDGGVWREPIGDGVAVLSPSGIGHDALGVRAPGVLIEGGRLQLFHMASDGVRWTLARAEGRTW